MNVTHPVIEGIVIRPMTGADLKYVLATWLRDLRAADASGLPDSYWFDAHREYIEDVLADDNTTKLVACASAWPDEILGYVVRTKDALEWINVKPKFRTRRLALQLLLQSDATSLPARWTTKLGRMRLRNLWRSRQLRTKQ